MTCFARFQKIDDPWLGAKWPEVRSIDDDEIIDCPLTLVIGYARASKRRLINEKRSVRGLLLAGKKTRTNIYLLADRSVVQRRDLGTKFATRQHGRRRSEIREKSPIGGRPKLTVLSDASLQIFLPLVGSLPVRELLRSPSDLTRVCTIPISRVFSLKYGWNCRIVNGKYYLNVFHNILDTIVIILRSCIGQPMIYKSKICMFLHDIHLKKQDNLSQQFCHQ